MNQKQQFNQSLIAAQIKSFDGLTLVIISLYFCSNTCVNSVWSSSSRSSDALRQAVKSSLDASEAQSAGAAVLPCAASYPMSSEVALRREEMAKKTISGWA